MTAQGCLFHSFQLILLPYITEVSHSCRLIHTAGAAAPPCDSFSETRKYMLKQSPPTRPLNVQAVSLLEFTHLVRTVTMQAAAKPWFPVLLGFKFHQRGEVSKRFGSVEAKTVALTAVSPFNLLPFSRGKRGVKKPLAWLRRVNPCARQNELEYFKHVHVCVCVRAQILSAADAGTHEPLSA